MNDLNIKILAVTGRLAQDQVKEAVRASRTKADVLVMDTDVAALISPQMLQNASPLGYDLILLPGSITADFSMVEEALGSKIRLGSKHAVDLKDVLDRLPIEKLSETVPACVLLGDIMADIAASKVKEIEAAAKADIVIRGTKIGGDSRMKVLAEIADCTRVSPEELAKRAGYFEAQGADMIDLGLPLNAKRSQVYDAVNVARSASDLPLSIDSLDHRLISAGVDAGADLVLSLNGRNISELGETLASAQVPAVVLPGPRTSLLENLDSAISLGVSVIADPILNPPLNGMSESIGDYLLFRRSRPHVPLFFGVGNATELIDADSQGVNAVLAAMASELGACILFTPEHSQKARGSVRELRSASMMMMLGQARKSPPKDLGIDLLMIKEKRRRPEMLAPDDLTRSMQSGSFTEIFRAKSSDEVYLDPAGPFRIGICDDQIIAVHAKAIIVGKTAKDVMDTIIKRGLVTRLDHAGYLGRELSRAENAIACGRSFAQDDSF